ncbi:uncharacterized protein VP01_109g1 [Puccinia sorghi]|uniref:Uncharacterized protein n=1 Tax=Puccinia sorghi TaxID=27349 RepID=A0A0L6VT46_9BASI|nr:uncharacterized protein VP01_109g1 [Puccinia sorghi]
MILGKSTLRYLHSLNLYSFKYLFLHPQICRDLNSFKIYPYNYPQTKCHRPRRPAAGVVGHPSNPSADDVLTTISNIRHGNNPPPPHVLESNNNFTYCSGMRHWRSNCPVLCRDAFLPPPQTPGHSTSVYAQPPATNRSIPSDDTHAVYYIYK